MKEIQLRLEGEMLVIEKMSEVFQGDKLSVVCRLAGGASSKMVFLDRANSLIEKASDYEEGGFEFFLLPEGSTARPGVVRIRVESGGVISEEATFFVQRSRASEATEEMAERFDLASRMMELYEGRLPKGKKPMERVCKFYGYPIAINSAWNIETAINIYKDYDILVLGDNYQNPEHVQHENTKAIVQGLRSRYPAIKIFGYVPIGRDPEWNDSSLGLDEIQRRINNWKTTGATHIFLDEFGYDYYITREHQNTCVQMVRDVGLGVCANSWSVHHIFSNENITLSWRKDQNGNDWQGNPTNLPCLLGPDDYFQLENFLYSYVHTPGQLAAAVPRVASNWRVYDAYLYNFDPQAQFGGKSYKEQYGTKSFALDAILTEDYRMFYEGWITAATLNVDAYGASVLSWGSSDSNYRHYTEPDFGWTRDDLSKPIVSSFGEDANRSNARYTATIGKDNVDIIWKQNSAVQDPHILEVNHEYIIKIRTDVLANGFVEMTFGNTAANGGPVFQVPVTAGDTIGQVITKIMGHPYGEEFLSKWDVEAKGEDEVRFRHKTPGALPGSSWWAWAPTNVFGGTNPTVTTIAGAKNIRRVTVNGELFFNEGGPSWRRPYSPRIGFMFFDTDLDKPIWHKGENRWADANGEEV